MNGWTSTASVQRAPAAAEQCAATGCSLAPTASGLCGGHAETADGAAECGACAFETSWESEQVGGIDLDPSAHTDACQSAALLGVHPRWH